MFNGNFNNFKNGLITFCMALFLILSITAVAVFFYSAYVRANVDEAIEFNWQTLGLFLFTIVLCFVVALVIGLVALLIWILFFPPSPLVWVIVAIVSVTLISLSVYVFLNTPLYTMLCDFIDNLIKMMQGT